MKTVRDLGILQQAFSCLCIPRWLDRLALSVSPCTVCTCSLFLAWTGHVLACPSHGTSELIATGKRPINLFLSLFSEDVKKLSWLPPYSCVIKVAEGGYVINRTNPSCFHWVCWVSASVRLPVPHCRHYYVDIYMQATKLTSPIKLGQKYWDMLNSLPVSPQPVGAEHKYKWGTRRGPIFSHLLFH